MPSQTVYLIRHGEVDGNVLALDRRLTVGEFNAMIAQVPHEAINAQGIEQSKALAPQLTHLNLTCLYSSPLLRAQQTAAILAEACGLPVLTHPELYEILPAPLTGPASRKLTLRQAYMLSGLRLVSPFTRDTENFLRAFRRMQRVWGELTRRCQTDFAIVGHQGIFRTLFVGIHLSPQWRLLQGDTHNGGISIIVRRT